MSGGFSPLHARMSEVLGYEAFFMSGSQVCAYVYGYPDVGLVGLGEMTESVRRLTAACNIPIFADADTGYGNAVNVYYTVQAYIRAGAADTEKVTSEADLRIKQYEEEIVKLRTVMQDRVTEQQAVVKSCNDKKLEIQKVLEFFGQETVARVVRESPKLKEPKSS